MARERNKLNPAFKEETYPEEQESGEGSIPSSRETFLKRVDGRSRYSRRYREIFQDIIDDLGGFDNVSEAKIQLAKRAAMISLRCEAYEASFVNGDDNFASDYDLAKEVNALARILQLLGIERKSKEMGPISVSDYLNRGGGN